MTFTSVQKKWLYRALIMLIFIFALGIRSYNLNGKQGMHIDEYWSFILSEYKDVGWTEDIAEGTYTVGELKAMVYAPSDPSFKGALSDVLRLWESNRDSPHTNLYYSALRLSLIGVEPSDNLMEELIFRAGILNLLTFSAVFIAFFVMLRLLLNKRGFILLGLAILSFNPFDIGNALFLRDYVFQTFFVVVFTSYLIYITKQLRAGIYTDSWQNLIKFGFAMSLMLWAGYYGFIYGFFVGLSFVLFVLRPCGKLKLIPYFFMACVVAVAFDCIYYQEFCQGFYQYQTLNSANNLSSIGDNLVDMYAKMAKFNLQWLLALFPILIIAIFVAYKKRHLPLFEHIKGYFWLIGATLLACIFISFISPVKTPRHLVPFIPVLLISIPLLCFGLKNKIYGNTVSIFFVLLFVLSALFSVKINTLFNLNYQYKHYNNPNFTSIYRTDLPVYLTKSRGASEFKDMSNGTRSFRIAAMDNNLNVIVSNIDLNGLSKEEAFAKMRENFDMPKEFILLYKRSSGKYYPETFENID